MPLTLRQIRENTNAARDLMMRARAEKFAVGSFSLDNQETLKAIVRAALVKKSPVIVEVNHSEAGSLGLDNIRDMVDNYKEEFGVEIYISLDHSPTLEAAIDGVEAGFEFIHMDIVQGNPETTKEEIIEKTKIIVDYSRLTGAIVESEPDYLLGSTGRNVSYEEVGKSFSIPEVARQFAEAAKIDIYAASVGNLHEVYRVPKKLDLDLLQKIRNSLDCGISLHGGSGIPAHYFEDAVAIGVSKINVNADMRIAFRKSLDKVLKENPDEISVMKLMGEVIGAVQTVVEHKIDMFGSSGRAQA